MLGNGGVADNDKIARASRQAVNGAIKVHPFEKGEEEGATEEVRDVVELSSCNRDARIVAFGGGQGAGQGGQPLRAHP